MRLSSGGRDVFFVADVEPGTGLYKFDMDVGASAKDFSSQSGGFKLIPFESGGVCLELYFRRCLCTFQAFWLPL